MSKYEVRRAVSDRDVREALALRRRVFVEEQGLFSATDEDEFDRASVFINAWKGGELLVGTVRCYPDLEDASVWWGGRLAVHEEYRARGIGVYLIEAAVEEMRARNVRRFLAQVQVQNVKLFEKLGWTPVSDVLQLRGHPHQTMEANLHVHAASRRHRRQSVVS